MVCRMALVHYVPTRPSQAYQYGYFATDWAYTCTQYLLTLEGGAWSFHVGKKHMCKDWEQLQTPLQGGEAAKIVCLDKSQKLLLPFVCACCVELLAAYDACSTSNSEEMTSKTFLQSYVSAEQISLLRIMSFAGPCIAFWEGEMQRVESTLGRRLVAEQLARLQRKCWQGNQRTTVRSGYTISLLGNLSFV